MSIEIRPGRYEIDPVHSTIGFSTRFVAARVRGRFLAFSGAVEVAEDLLQSSVTAVIDVSSIFTGTEARDEHLRGEDYFDVDHHAEATFSSTALESDGDRYTLRGDLTIRSTTRPVELDLFFTGDGEDHYGNFRIGFACHHTPVAVRVRRRRQRVKAWRLAIDGQRHRPHARDPGHRVRRRGVLMSTTISAMTVASAGAPFSRRSLELDGPQPNEVLVRIEAVGMCHADLAVRAGEFPFPLPGVAGHEGAGTVEADRVGRDDGAPRRPRDPDLRLLRTVPGVRPPVIPSQCEEFVPRNFTNGARPDGSPACTRALRWCTATSSASPRSPRTPWPASATPFWCPRSPPTSPPRARAPGLRHPNRCRRGVERAAAGSRLTVAVFGAGVVGLSAVMAAALLPIDRLIVVDVLDSRLELARELGATTVINSRTTDPIEAIKSVTGGGAGYVVESSGVPSVLVQAIKSLRAGGTAAVVGVPPFGVTAPIDVADMVNNSKRVIGVVEGRSNPPTFLPDLAVLVATGQLPVDKLVTTFSLGEVERAAEAMKNGTATKPVLLPEEDV